LRGLTWQFAELDGYETPIKDGFLHDVLSGDLNQDGRKDLIFLETGKSYIDIVTFDEPHKLVPANRWQAGRFSKNAPFAAAVMIFPNPAKPSLPTSLATAKTTSSSSSTTASLFTRRSNYFTAGGVGIANLKLIPSGVELPLMSE
jgi:hypothetical protein